MLVASLLVDLVWLIKASIPNFNFLVSLKVAQIYLPRMEWVGGLGLTVIIMQVSVQIELNWNYQLELGKKGIKASRQYSSASA